VPIRPDLWNLRDPATGEFIYHGPSWGTQRHRLLERCGDRCERCRVPNHTTVVRWEKSSWWVVSTNIWHHPDNVPPRAWQRIRTVRVVLTMAHLSRNPLDNEDAQKAMLCQACHFWWDRLRNADAARITRQTQKDAARPLLAEELMHWDRAQLGSAGAGI
jgi:hypothetical protein